MPRTVCAANFAKAGMHGFALGVVCFWLTNQEPRPAKFSGWQTFEHLPVHGFGRLNPGFWLCIHCSPEGGPFERAAHAGNFAFSMAFSQNPPRLSSAMACRSRTCFSVHLMLSARMVMDRSSSMT